MGLFRSQAFQEQPSYGSAPPASEHHACAHHCASPQSGQEMKGHKENFLPAVSVGGHRSRRQVTLPVGPITHCCRSWHLWVTLKIDLFKCLATADAFLISARTLLTQKKKKNLCRFELEETGWGGSSDGGDIWKRSNLTMRGLWNHKWLV